MTQPHETVWYPGVYGGRTDGDFGTFVSQLPADRVITLVQERVQHDGQWAIDHNLVGENEDKMRRMMAWAADAKNITQCLAHLDSEKQLDHRTVDWVCRDLADAARWSVK